MTPKRIAELEHGTEVAVWLAKPLVRAARYGAGNRAAPTHRGSGCWQRATVFFDPILFPRPRLVIGERLIPLPRLSFLQIGDLDFRAPDPRP